MAEVGGFCKRDLLPASAILFNRARGNATFESTTVEALARRLKSQFHIGPG
jgi:hypothetical protein